MIKLKLFFIAFSVLIVSTDYLFSQAQKKDSLEIELQKLQKKPDFQKDSLYINLLYKHGREFGHYNLDSLRLLANESIQFSKTIAYAKGEVQGYILLGNYNSEIGQQDKAVKSFVKALSLAEGIQNLKLILLAKSSLATEYIYKDDYAKALKEYLNAIEIAQQNNIDKSLALLYVNITVLYSMQKEYQQCIYYLTKAIELNEKLNDVQIKPVTLVNLASTYIDINDFKNASEKVDESIPLFEKLGMQEWLTFAYEVKATIYLKQDKFNQALLWFQKSNKIHENIDQSRYKIPLYSGMSKAYFGLKDYKKTEIYALKALEIGEKINILDDRDEVLKSLYEVKKITNDPNAALFYFEKFKTISDTINKKNNEKELRVLESNLKFEQEKEKYTIENEKRIAQQKSYFYTALLVILTFAIIIFILRRNNKIQDELNRKLTLKTEELKKNEKFLKNANNNKSKLFSIIAHDLKGPILSFKSILDFVDSGDIKTNDFVGIVPKMGDNINSILFTLNNLLSWSRTQMNGSLTSPSMNNAQLLVEENIALHTKTAEKKSITLINTIDFDIMTWSDKNHITIVIRNLISNALKFTPENGTITVGAEESMHEWKIFFKDEGIGMNDDMLDMVFNDSDPFTTFGTNNEKGTGLGLSLCKEMVEKNSGAIWAESTVNVGSCFYFTIPKKPFKSELS